METSLPTTRLSTSDQTRARLGASSWLTWALTVVLIGVALLLRLSVIAEVFTPRGVRLLTVDAYLHFRRILLTAQQFPGLSSFDPYANYPDGVVVTWPPLWDWSVALLGRIVALGRLDEATLLTVAALFPVAVGVMTVLSVGALAWLVFGRGAALPAAFFAAVSPALRLVSQVGNADHHAGVSFGVVLIAIATALIARLSESHTSPSLRSLLSRAILLALAMSGSLMVWLGSIVPAFLAWLFFLLLVVARGREASRRVMVAGFSFLAAGLVLLPFLSSVQPTFGAMSSLHVSALVLGGFVLLLSAIAVRRAGRALLLVALVLVAVTMSLGALVGALRPLVDAALSGVVKAFGWYPWAQQTNEWLPLLDDGSGWTFTNAEVLYGKLVYLVPTLLLGLIARDLFVLLRTKAAGCSALSGVSEHGVLAAARVSFYLFALGFLGMALTARVYHQLSAPVTAVIWGSALVLLAESVVVPLLRTMRVAPSTRSSFVSQTVLVGLVGIALVVNSLGTERLGMAPSKDLLAAMEWLESRTPSVGDASNSASRPTYGVMSTWQYGDYIAGIAKRPVVADGANEWNLDGFVRSQRFFQSLSESEAGEMLASAGLRYVVVGAQFTYVDGDLTRAGPPSGWIDPQSPRNLAHNEMPPEARSTILYNRLYAAAFADASRPVRGLSHFRMAYIGSEDGMPLFIYEYVRGATLVGKVDPGSEVGAYIQIANSRGRRIVFQFATKADQDGRYRLTVPYPTGWLSQGLGTEDSYTFAVGHEPIANVLVTEEAVRNGADVAVP